MEAREQGLGKDWAQLIGHQMKKEPMAPFLMRLIWHRQCQLQQRPLTRLPMATTTNTSR
ncbi:hypothetical protein D3C84_1156530 [compost metagenome]